MVADHLFAALVVAFKQVVQFVQDQPGGLFGAHLLHGCLVVVQPQCWSTPIPGRFQHR